MYDLNTLRSIQRWENEGGKLMHASRMPAAIKGRWRDRHLVTPAADTRSSNKSLRRKKALVVPIDLSLPCTEGLDFALSMAGKLDCRVLVIHVVPRLYGEGFIETDEKKEWRRRAVRSAERKLKDLIAARRYLGV